MHIKTKSLVFFCLSMFISFSSFGGITERLTQWKDAFLTDQDKKFEQAVNELKKESSSYLENSEDNINIKKNLNFNFKDSIQKNFLKYCFHYPANITVQFLVECLLANAYYDPSRLEIYRKMDDSPIELNSPINRALLKNHLFGLAVGLVVGLAKRRLSFALAASFLATCFGLTLFREGDIRAAMTIRAPLPYGRNRFENELKLINSIMGSEIDFPIEDGRSYLLMHPVVVKELMENAEANQKCIALRILDRINPFKQDDTTSEYKQLQNILSENEGSDVIKIPKKLLPYLYSHTYEEGFWDTEPERYLYLIEHWYQCYGDPDRLYTMNSNINLYRRKNDFHEYDSRPPFTYYPCECNGMDLRHCIDRHKGRCDNKCGGMHGYFCGLFNLLHYLNWGKAKIQYDEDGTPRIYKKDREDNWEQDDEAMKLCGLHGIPYSSLKEKQEQEASSNSYISILKEQQEGN